MKAVKVIPSGESVVLTYEQVEPPVSGPHQVTVEVSAIGVNFMDLAAKTGAMGGNYRPDVPGVEGAGRIVAMGAEVTGFQIGDRVAWVFVRHSYAQQIVADVDALVKIPDDIDDHTAAAVMMQGLTASHFATCFYPVQPGDIALVHAGAGGLGRLLTQIIKLRGGTVISRVSSEAKIAVAKAAGADHVIVSDNGTFAQEAIRLSAGEGVHVVYDGSGPATFQGSLDALRRAGTFCWYGPVLGGPGPIDIMSLPKSIKLGYAVFFDHIHTPDLLREKAGQLFDWLRCGALTIEIGGVYPLADADKALTDLQSRKTTGKLILIP
ncbi:quinone oxidoreductase family protein [Pseudomonas abietaniphila]|uniref:NADPH2:quinone reductase n=1 Tax=Pseudomonas abietaniphila TaxID=89065 RepID=A0A1G7RPB6_9PSED|nr:quinone oxidoreductase [Pseudomonas abietaniphila]SDG12545.1 NADPH2:quinone reductase [Pseudomonas abietaniphila]